MKTTLPVLALGLSLTSLVWCVGCGEGRANAEIPKFADATPAILSAAEPATPPPTATPIAVPTTPLIATPSVEPTNSPDTKSAPLAAAASTNATNVARQTAAPQVIRLTPGLAEVVKLAQAGVGEDVLLAYITNSAQIFELGSNEILYLHDLGVPSPVITALIQHDAAPEVLARRQAAAAVRPLPPGIGLTTPATNVYPPKVVSQPPEPTPVNPPGAGDAGQPQPAQVIVQQPIVVQEPVTISYFQSELAPYGSWVDVPGYGNCWRPTVAVCNSSWRPYGDHGRWLWSDAGWYWYSDYSWGWAPFHYGRWACPAGIGWVWRPDTHWGPSWVSWRSTSSYCGWAPLPPSAVWVSGHGFYHNTLSVGVNFDFGLFDWQYVYLPSRRFCDRNPYHHYVSHSHAQAIHKDSTVINNYVSGGNNTIINHGVGLDHVAKVTRGDIRQVALKNSTSVRDLSPRRERLETDGKTLTITRPTFAASRIIAPEKPISALSGIKSKPPTVPPVASNPSSSAKPPVFTSKQPASGSAPVSSVSDSAGVAKPASSNAERPRVFKTVPPNYYKPPSQVSVLGGPATTTGDSVVAPVNSGSVPPGSIIIKPASPSPKSGVAYRPNSVPSWMDNSPSSGVAPAAKTPVFQNKTPTVTTPALSPATPSTAPTKSPTLARSTPAPSYAQPSPAKSPGIRSYEAPQPKMSAPAPVRSAPPRYQPAPSAPSHAAPSVSPRNESGRSYSAPKAPVYSGNSSRSVPSTPSSSSRSSNSDSRKDSR